VRLRATNTIIVTLVSSVWNVLKICTEFISKTLSLSWGQVCWLRGGVPPSLPPAGLWGGWLAERPTRGFRQPEERQKNLPILYPCSPCDYHLPPWRHHPHTESVHYATSTATLHPSSVFMETQVVLSKDTLFTVRKQDDKLCSVSK